MSSETKIWLIVAACLVIAGGLVFRGVMAHYDWDFRKLSTVEYETNSYETNEEYENISVLTNTADVVFVPCEGDTTTVVCYEEKKVKHLVGITDATLVIEAVDTRKWYEYIGINFYIPKITVNIPKDSFGTLNIKTETGKVELPAGCTFDDIDVSVSTGYVNVRDVSCGKMRIKAGTGNIRAEKITAAEADLSVTTGNVKVSEVNAEGNVTIGTTTGDVTLTDVECGGLVSSGNTGDITLERVDVKGKLSIERSTGDVKLEHSDAREIFIETDTGDVAGTLLSEKVFITNAGTGSVDVPKSVTGGRCEISIGTGDIKVSVSK